jgi:MoaA/NifB/PqqE/SkfB family radical SAM enzyme
MAAPFSVKTEALSTHAHNPGGPWRVTLVTNPDDCNLTCGMCACGVARAGGEPTAPHRRMDAALALAVLDERRGTALREVIPSTMGEPLLWPGLATVLERCRALELRVNMTTNGTFPGRGPSAWAEALVPVARDVKISWNGATASTAEALMPGLSFAAAIDGVRTFAAVRDRHARAGGRRCTLSFQVTAREENVGELAAVVRLAARLGVDRVKLNHLQVRAPALAPLSLRRTPETILRWNAAVRAVRSEAEAARLAGTPVALENAVELWPDPAAPAPLGPCRFAGREAWVHWDGRLAPCPHPAAERGELGDFGTLARASLGALWAGSALRAFLEGHGAHPVCAACSFRRPGGA